MLCLGTTVLDATYLERPLWVADKGRQQSVSYGNEKAPSSLFQPANEPSWIVPEPYRIGAEYPERAENQLKNQQVQELPSAAQKVQEERLPYDGYGQNQAFAPHAAYEYQPMYQGQPSQPAWMNQQQQQQVEYLKPYPAQEPTKQQAQPEPDHYSAYGGFEQQGWNVPENSPLNSYQSQFQTQVEMNQPNNMDPYQPRPDADIKTPVDKPKPEQTIESFPTKPEEQSPNFAPVQPQELQQGYNPYVARPELYQPGPVYVEPQYQVPYYGQQPFPALTEPEQYWMQMPGNQQPSYQTFKPVEESNKVKKPTQQENRVEQAPTDVGYYPYQPQVGWYPYQQNPQAGLQAFVQTEPALRAGESDFQGYQSMYDRNPMVEKPKPQVPRKPVSPPRTEQRPNRPIVQQQTEQPTRLPSVGWEAPYVPVQPVEPVMPKPRPQQQRPTIVKPTYNSQPDTSYW
uniref:Uncharacterized protein n=1 Tax=Anopheles maculatus TaxID=74869 RepID=A0A182SF50_9DIPT